MLTANMKMIAECADKLAHLGEKLFNETEMKYRAGDKVRIKSLDWYNENKDMNDLVGLFTPSMKKLCGMVVTLDSAYNGKYTAIEKDAKGYYLDDSMIEGLVEEENEKKLSDESWRYKNIFDNSQYPQSFECPEGYMFKDENGNVINATKIVLEKKKKEYPKTYEECIMSALQGEGYNRACLLVKFEKLLTCRDAYWKIYGEEMGLGKPWEPDWENSEERRYCIVNINGEINLPEKTLTKWILKVTNKILVFPTEEMRDAFYENFKELIEQCKELL